MDHDSLLIERSQKTKNIYITCIRCWTNVEDVGPTLYRCYTKCFVFAGLCSIIQGERNEMNRALGHLCAHIR